MAIYCCLAVLYALLLLLFLLLLFLLLLFLLLLFAIEGLAYEEIEDEFQKKLQFTEKQLLTTDQIIVALSERLETERDVLTNGLQGIAGFPVLSPVERESLFSMLLIMQLRAVNEMCFESGALVVGLTERLHHHTHQT